MDGSDGEVAEGFLPNDSCRLRSSHCCRQASAGVITRERLCNLRRTQRHFNKLEFMRQCGLCNTFSVMLFAYVYCSCHTGAVEKYNITPLLLLFKAQRSGNIGSCGEVVTRLLGTS